MPRWTRASIALSSNWERQRAVLNSTPVSAARVRPPSTTELSGVGSRFPRIHLIESVLQPSRTIAPGFQTFAVTLKGGRVLTGVRVAEADDMLTLADAQGNKHLLRKSRIEDQQPQAVSVMPEGLEKPLSVDEFVDLIAFLSSLKSDRSR